ncbi:hypothetical protein KXD40_001822 [Peronospora effusa]|uniref:Cohesin loading complex subunit SCC4 homolog n=1 Tax=Peronospora effusa TaxID=542832 RepID=A0A3R7VXT7_9STRA|nr:hypothetical protein DD237_000370 [Peronospora effusa]UIZ26957.1 hypothetical protein KXD40_001822 [Peronospora effusa]
MTEASVELRSEDVRQLWSLACLLAEKQLINQTAMCLEPLCAIDCSTRSAAEQEILVQANVLFAELCSVACNNRKKADNQDLWTHRVNKTEKCIHSVDAAIARGVVCSQVNKLRLLKAKYLLQQQLKVERSVKSRRILEILLEGLKISVEGDDVAVVTFQKYFEVKLKACLVKMHAATVMTKYAKDSKGINNFADNLLYIRTTLPNCIHKHFLLWLVEATCHTAISSFHPGDIAGMSQLVDFGEEFFDRVCQQEPVSTDFRLHHLISMGFYYLRTGKVMKVTPLLEQVKILTHGDKSNGDQMPAENVKESYLSTILDSMRVSVVAYSNPKEACDLAMTTILAAQANLQTYAQFPAVRLMLIGTLFDMLHVYCRLLNLQCRYADTGASIVQMVALFVTYRADLERTVLYRFFLARCHTLIAKYAATIGKVKDACAHLNFVVDKVLPVPTVDETSYPDAYLAVWVDVLEVATYCCGTGTAESLSTSSSNLMRVQIKHISPSQKLLEWVARIFVLDGLRHQIHQCCNVELRAKYNLALAKWMWATKRLSDIAKEEGRSPFTQHTALEELRPKMFALLHEALQRINTSVSCCETTSEIMALFGPQLVAIGDVEQGESILKKAIRIALHSKNVLLQTRLLANVVELYKSKGQTAAQAAAAIKYEKKLAVLQRRIATAQNEGDTTAALLRWTVGSSKSTNTSRASSHGEPN